jgi:hypothetical protein
MLARKAAAMTHASDNADALPFGDDTLEAFAEKLSRFRTTLEGPERQWLDTILLAGRCRSAWPRRWQVGSGSTRRAGRPGRSPPRSDPAAAARRRRPTAASQVPPGP